MSPSSVRAGYLIRSWMEDAGLRTSAPFPILLLKSFPFLLHTLSHKYRHSSDTFGSVLDGLIAWAMCMVGWMVLMPVPRLF